MEQTRANEFSTDILDRELIGNGELLQSWRMWLILPIVMNVWLYYCSR